MAEEEKRQLMGGLSILMMTLAPADHCRGQRCGFFDDMSEEAGKWLAKGCTDHGLSWGIGVLATTVRFDTLDSLGTTESPHTRRLALYPLHCTALLLNGTSLGIPRDDDRPTLEGLIFRKTIGKSLRTIRSKGSEPMFRASTARSDDVKRRYPNECKLGVTFVVPVTLETGAKIRSNRRKLYGLDSATTHSKRDDYDVDHEADGCHVNNASNRESYVCSKRILLLSHDPAWLCRQRDVGKRVPRYGLVDRTRGD
jgi:hypothetical protein